MKPITHHSILPAEAVRKLFDLDYPHDPIKSHDTMKRYRKSGDDFDFETDGRPALVRFVDSIQSDDGIFHVNAWFLEYL